MDDKVVKQLERLTKGELVRIIIEQIEALENLHSENAKRGVTHALEHQIAFARAKRGVKE